MFQTQLRDTGDVRATQVVAPTEPSHIHIPRPSRVRRQLRLPEPDLARALAPREPALDEAA